MTAARTLTRIVATTDVHSGLDHAHGLMAHLHAARTSSLVVDCGDFFEGTGYYRLGNGTVEREILLRLYDVLAPGNHGWLHHFEPGLRERTVCANVVDDACDEPLFRPLHRTSVGGRRVAVTAVIGPQAFAAIPLTERAGHRVTDPVTVLRRLMLEHHHTVDDWILLSHTGFEDDLDLARQCPFLDVVFAGHCHSRHYAPERVGTTLVVKGAELGLGYALAEPNDTTGWTARSHHFPDDAGVPDDLVPLADEIGRLRARLAVPLGRVAPHWRGAARDPQALLSATATRLHREHGVAVILNETALRPTALGRVLRLADVLGVEPFGNRLTRVHLTDALARDVPGLLAHLALRGGPLVIASHTLPAAVPVVLTTDYLAQTLDATRPHEIGPLLGDVVRDVLTDPGERDEGEPQ
ncbi:bifunctional metallophosphatase/5'-nucleotidase [Streptomyces sp. SID3343]|uniref:bifunctional metallophosphatase/5'-nucleotidase n=1 Tax=Streptomyces sp. SID3343 TaxID=2690260 RepID=UPI00136F3BCC|nr:bifunctional metallophosphatase/5'-nucleotidase [Streptomyces sp. SID3343]MYV98203.1 bifunctional metallophosphatase/5'-nucleotidase [Streptomyces sp. SID3343]